MPILSILAFVLLLPPPAGVSIDRTIEVNRQFFTHLSQYTCLETISRNEPTRPNHKPHKQDVIQLDVGIGNQSEVYSWPGAPVFSSKDLPDLVGHGMLATGVFRSFANNLFISNVAIIKPAGEDKVEGKKAVHFSYTIPSLTPIWQVNWLGATGAVDEQGEFWVEPDNLTLLRLRVEAQNIPTRFPLNPSPLISATKPSPLTAQACFFPNPPSLPPSNPTK